MNSFTAQNFQTLGTAQNIFGIGTIKMNIDGEWVQLGTPSIFDKLMSKQAARNFPWEVTQNEWMKQQNTGFIPSHTYESYVSSYAKEKDLNKYPILLDTKNFAGKDIQFRQKDEPLRYVDHDQEGNILRDEQGELVYLTDQALQEADVPTKDDTIHIFDGNVRIGHVGDSFGATELFVDKNYQNKGIGSYALKLFLSKYPTRAHKPRHLGQMTNAGDSTARKSHRLLVEQALRDGKQIPPEVLQEYGLTPPLKP